MRLVDLEYQCRLTSTRLKLSLESTYLEALKQLWSNKDLIILCLDKGQGAIVMDISDYESKMESILPATKDFLPTDFTDGTQELEKIISKKLKLHLNGNFIEAKLHN